MASEDSERSRPDLPTVSAPPELYRIHRAQSDGLELPPWQYARSLAPDGQFNFGGRWDDPHPVEGERFRTLSLGNDRIGVALEVFQSLRPDPTLLALEAQLRDSEVERGSRPTINVSDLTSRRMSVVELEPGAKFLDVTSSKARAYLEEQLSPMLEREGIPTLKIGDLLGKETQLSQRVAEIVHDQFPEVAGLATPSTLGTDFTNYYVFESEPESGRLRAEGRILESNILSSKDPEIRIALEELRLDIASDVDPTLRVSPAPVPFRVPDALPVERAGEPDARVDLSALPVFEPRGNDIVELREDFRNAADQSMTVLGRSEESDRVFGREGGAVLSVAREAFTEVPRVDDRITIRNVDGRDRAEPDARDVALEM